MCFKSYLVLGFLHNLLYLSNKDHQRFPYLPMGLVHQVVLPDSLDRMDGHICIYCYQLYQAEYERINEMIVNDLNV